MSEHHRNAWGAREDAVWWPGAITTTDQQTLHHQHLLNQHHQQQLAAAQVQAQQLQQHQQQQAAVAAAQQQAHNDAVARSTASTMAATQQLFSYKMASSFQNPATTMAGSSVSSTSPAGAYDYRLNMGGMVGRPGDPPSMAAAAPGTQWWYPGTNVENALQQVQQQQQQQQQQQVQQQQQQQNMHNVQTPPPSNQQQQSSQNQQNQSAQNQGHQVQQQSQQTTQNQSQQTATTPAVQQQQQVLHQQQTIITPKRMPRGKNDSKPRGRMTAYAFFVQTCREEHKKKHPEENVIFAEFSKKCAERWKTMLDKEKKRFHEMAEKDKKRYDLEMQSYVPPKGEKPGRGKKRKQIKDPNAPKRSLSAFFWFCNDERGKVKAINPEYGVGDIAKELGRRWSDCDPEAKSKYEAMAEKDKARYDREMTAYKKKPKVVEPEPEEEEEEEAEEDDDDE